MNGWRTVLVAIGGVLVAFRILSVVGHHLGSRAVGR